MQENEPLHSDGFINAMRAIMQDRGLNEYRLAALANSLADDDEVPFLVTNRWQVERVITKREARLTGPKGRLALRYWMRALRLPLDIQETLILAAGLPLEDQQEEATQKLQRLTSGEMPVIPKVDEPDPLRARSLELPTTGELGDLPERVRRRLVPRRPVRKVEVVAFSEQEGRWIDATR